MNARRGVTLVEVLVAIFIAAIGALSLLVLFPLGALNMARAIRDDRCAQAGINATALADALNLRDDANIEAQLSAGNPVYVDGIGAQVILGGGAGPFTGVGGLGGTAPTTAIPRVLPSYVTSNLIAYKNFRLQDDITFDSNGAATATSGFVDRGGRYSWAYMIRRSSTVVGPSTMSVIVYDGRNTAIAGGETCYLPAAPSSGTSWPVGSTSITIQYSGAPLPLSPYTSAAPPLRRGDWILDASVKDAANDPPDTGNLHSFFYRVVEVTDTGTTVELELETPLQAAIDGATATTPGIIVFLENVANVYERRTGWRP